MLRTMFFFAKIRPGSSIYRLWKYHTRLGGNVDGVMFRWDGKNFASTELTQEQIEAFRVRQDQAVTLEIFSHRPPMVELPELVEADTASASKPRRQRQRLDE